MRTMTTTILILLFSMTTVLTQEATAQDITVKVLNFDSNKGKLFIALFNSETSYTVDEYKSSISKINNKECYVTFKNVPAGDYAITLFHDENDNGKMDTNMFGVPKEDYGFSNNAKGFMGPAKWADAKFEVKDTTIIQTIKL